MSSKLDLQYILNAVKNATELEILEKIHLEYLSKKGYFADQMKKLATLPVEEKKEFGLLLNQQKNQITEALKLKQKELYKKNILAQMIKEKVDLTLPVPNIPQGSLHPLSYVTEQLVAVFASLGYTVEEGPEIEEDWYNFTALNVPAHHPARQDHDTFYLKSYDINNNRKVLRTHTSNMQIRTMQSQKDILENNEKIQIVSLGKTYRSDSDATHSPMFHQIEGLLVDKAENISVPLLKSTLIYFCQKFFDLNEVPLRFRPSYFPFTSPSYEVDIACKKTKDKLIIGEQESWLEILGAGIVHPNVLENCGIDSAKYAGFAFGMGIERLAMLKYGFKDLREFYNGDVKWLKHYNFKHYKIPTLAGGLN